MPLPWEYLWILVFGFCGGLMWGFWGHFPRKTSRKISTKIPFKKKHPPKNQGNFLTKNPLRESSALRCPGCPIMSGMERTIYRRGSPLLFSSSWSEASMVFSLLSGPMVYTLFPCRWYTPYFLDCSVTSGLRDRPREEGCHGGGVYLFFSLNFYLHPGAEWLGLWNSESGKGGWKTQRKGKLLCLTYHKTSPQKHFWAPPPPMIFRHVHRGTARGAPGGREK